MPRGSPPALEDAGRRRIRRRRPGARPRALSGHTRGLVGGGRGGTAKRRGARPRRLGLRLGRRSGSHRRGGHRLDQGLGHAERVGRSQHPRAARLEGRLAVVVRRAVPAPLDFVSALRAADRGLLSRPRGGAARRGRGRGPAGGGGGAARTHLHRPPHPLSWSRPAPSAGPRLAHAARLPAGAHGRAEVRGHRRQDGPGRSASGARRRRAAARALPVPRRVLARAPGPGGGGAGGVRALLRPDPARRGRGGRSPRLRRGRGPAGRLPPSRRLGPPGGVGAPAPGAGSLRPREPVHQPARPARGAPGGHPRAARMARAAPLGRPERSLLAPRRRLRRSRRARPGGHPAPPAAVGGALL